MNDGTKWRCEECGNVSKRSELLEGTNPFLCAFLGGQDEHAAPRAHRAIAAALLAGAALGAILLAIAQKILNDAG